MFNKSQNMALIQCLSTKTLFLKATGTGLFGITVAICCRFAITAHPVFFPVAQYVAVF